MKKGRKITLKEMQDGRSGLYYQFFQDAIDRYFLDNNNNVTTKQDFSDFLNDRA